MTPSLLLPARTSSGPESLAEYRARGGYQGLELVRTKGAAWLRGEVATSLLRGRGGAAFPTARKWELAAAAASEQKFVVANGGEHEPGSHKDRHLVEHHAHAVLEGLALAGVATGATRGYLYLIEDMHGPRASAERALQEASDAGLLPFPITIHLGPTTYVAGEETAALAAIEGQPAKPRKKPPFPGEAGLFGKPTTINNTETFAAVPWIIRNGGAPYLAIGKPNNGGTKIFSVVGDVNRPGNFEIPLGTPFSKLLELAGGVKGGALKAVIPGGSSAPVLPANIMMDITMDYDAIAKAGSMLGSGAVIVMNDTRCMVKSLLRLSYFYQHESCGQCTPCREGTGWLWRMVDRIEHGHGRMEDIELLGSVASNIMGRTICALGDAAAMPVQGMIKHFRDEFVHHVEHKRCVVGTAVTSS